MLFIFFFWNYAFFLTVPDTINDIKIKGIESNVVVSREEGSGAIHINANSDKDLYFAQNVFTFVTYSYFIFLSQNLSWPNLVCPTAEEIILSIDLN